MTDTLSSSLLQEITTWNLTDPHTHIDARSPAAKNLAEIMGYHYYTELAHSAGMAKARIEEDDLEPKELVGRLVEHLGPIENTIQYSWLIEIAQTFFGFEDECITSENWEALYDRSLETMQQPDWTNQVMQTSKLDGVFLTNDFDDTLGGFDTKTYIPCLRTDDLVFHLANPTVQNRLQQATGISLDSVLSLRQAIGALFEHFASNNARACAISLPPNFSPDSISIGRAETAISAVLSQGLEADESHRRACSQYVFWTLAEYCQQYELPFDLMIGVNRSVYPEGVFQGMDLYDSRVSLIQYAKLFNAFPQVTFPISVLASVTNQELTSYAWIFPNVVTNGHWWYSNTPTFIEHDAACRLEAVPATKQIGYYSDMYKLEFALPKFNMYKRILAKILAEKFVVARGWSESRALDLAKNVLCDNVSRIFLR